MPTGGGGAAGTAGPGIAAGLVADEGLAAKIGGQLAGDFPAELSRRLCSGVTRHVQAASDPLVQLTKTGSGKFLVLGAVSHMAG